MTQRTYRRLPGSGVSWFQSRTLWLGPDHVLSVHNTPISEEYRRFYLRDIQALVLAESRSSIAYYLAATAGVVALVTAGLLLNRYWIWGALGLLISFILVRLSWSVPDCACYLKTATGVHRLPSLGKLRAARKAVAVLEPLIQAAQRAPA
jgi:hypothetical protein